VDVYLVRHAIAEARGPHVEEGQRALTEEGAARFALHVAALQQLGVKLDEIWTSPLARARQTAELLRPLEGTNGLRIVEDLSPDGSIERLVEHIAARPELGSVALVGHEPGMSLLASALLAAGDEAGIEFKKGAVACIEVQPSAGASTPADEAAPLSKRVRAHSRLRWLMTPRQLRTLAAGEAPASECEGKPEAGMGDSPVCRLVAFAREQLNRLRASLDGIGGDDDADAVHDFRVATRRLNEPLRIMAALRNRKRVKAVRLDLGRLRRAFRTVRDLDVLVGSVGADRDAGRLDEGAAAWAIATLGAARALAVQAAVKTAAGLKPVRTARRIEVLCDTFAAAPDVPSEADACASVVARWEAKAVGALGFAPELPPGSDLHALRIQLKGLRYCTELRAAILDFSAAELLATLRRVQDSLGLWNDHQFASRTLTRLAVSAAALSHPGDGSPRLLRYAADRIEDMRRLEGEARTNWPGVREMIERLAGRSKS